MNAMFLLALAIILGILGQICLKFGANFFKTIDLSSLSASSLLPLFTNPYVVFGVIAYMSSAVFWILTLTKVELSFAYPLISVSYVVVSLLSAVLFNEKITVMRWLGIILIALGAFFISRT